MTFNNKNTPSILAIIFVIFSFLILMGASSGLFSSPESLQTQTIQGIFGLLMLIAGYYYGTIHKNNDTQTQQKMPESAQVFWDIQSIQDTVTEINGNPITPTAVADMGSINSKFEVMQDNTDQYVLVVHSASIPITMKLQNASSAFYIAVSVTAEFAGGRPSRPK